MQIQAGQRWDIFCRIVDNFGDIGVCWRLSQQLAREHHLQIRIFIDNLEVAGKIIPSLNCTLNSQVIEKIEVCKWPISFVGIKPAKVALETFSCGLPADYLATMQDDATWVNLEYLSAETWVDNFHARSSNNTKPPRHFYFPGFTEATGGLIREVDIFRKNQEVANNRQLQMLFLNHFNVLQDIPLKVSLFCYPHAPIHALLNAMAESNLAIHCYVPTSSILSKIAEFFGKSLSKMDGIPDGEKLSYKNLDVFVLPFLSQTDYDKLLATCDINFVRGEDSWVRAIWAAKPFIWQPYLQTEETHITKLNAFLDLFYANADQATKAAIYDANLAWAQGNSLTTIWQNYLDNLQSIRQITLQQAKQLATQTDLAAKLVIFLQKL